MISSILNKKPVYLLLHVTGKCNAECSHCFYWEEIQAGKTEKDIAFQDYKKLSKSMEDILVVNLCGAEAYLRKDLCEIAHLFASQNRCRLITIPSNGYLTDQIVSCARRLCQENPETFFRFAFSLDGPRESHDRIRGVEGLFDKACETIRQIATLKKEFSNFVLMTSTVFSQETEGHILEFLDWIQENLPVEQTNVTFIRGNPLKPATLKVNSSIYQAVIDKVKKNAALQNQDKKLEALLPYSMFLETMKTVDEAYANPGKRVFHCFAGQKFLVVGRKGDVYPCELLDEKSCLGNLKDFDWSLPNLLSSQQSKSVVDWIAEEHCACTWECAIQASKIFDWKNWSSIAGTAGKVAIKSL